MAEKKIRVLLAKKKIDVHGRGSKFLARELRRNAGMEVIYFGFGTVEEIVNAAVQEDVDVIGVSIMTSGHGVLPIAERLIPALKEKGMTEVLVVVGGVIPEVDFEPLEGMGVHDVCLFRPARGNESRTTYAASRQGPSGLREERETSITKPSIWSR